MDTKEKIIIDWFSATIPCKSSETTVTGIVELLGLSDVPWERSYGFYGWQYRETFSNISIHFGGVQHEGLIMLEMSGQGCRTFETLGNGDFLSLFKFVFSVPGAKVTRIDVAFDDFSGYLNLDEIVKDTLNHNFIAKTRKWGVNLSDSGTCVTHGQRSGSVFIRIYDKAAERNKQDEISHWVRCELQIRQDRAVDFVRLLVEENEVIDDLYFAVLNHYLRYVKISESDSNKWRSEIADHWENFYNYKSVQERSIYKKPGMEYNAAKLRSVYGERFAGGIYTYINLFGVNTLLEDVEAAKSKLNPKYKLLLQEDAAYKKGVEKYGFYEHPSVVGLDQLVDCEVL